MDYQKIADLRKTVLDFNQIVLDQHAKALKEFEAAEEARRAGNDIKSHRVTVSPPNWPTMPGVKDVSAALDALLQYTLENASDPTEDETQKCIDALNASPTVDTGDVAALTQLGDNVIAFFLLRDLVHNHKIRFFTPSMKYFDAFSDRFRIACSK